MKALTFQRYGKSPGIALTDVPHPAIKADELLVKVHAASLNPIDNMIPSGMFKPVLRFQLPAIMGSDLAGVVTEVGRNVTRFKPGDAIFALLKHLSCVAQPQDPFVGMRKVIGVIESGRRLADIGVETDLVDLLEAELVRPVARLADLTLSKKTLSKVSLLS